MQIYFLLLIMKKKNNNNTKIFSITKKMKKLCCVIYRKYRKFEKPKIYFFKKTVLSIMCSKCKNENEKLFKEEESISIEISKITALIENI